MEADGPWVTPNGEMAGERAASGDRDGEKLGDMAIEETEPSWLIGDRFKVDTWGRVRPTAGFGRTVLAPG